MKPIFPFFLTLSILFHLQLNAQNTITEISGVINDFTKVITIDYCTSELTVNSTEGFLVGMPVVLIQVKGATIKNSNSSSFGEIEAMNNTGKYETNIVHTITGDRIFLRHEILNTFDDNSVIQLVSMPSYEDVEVNNLLTTDAWDGNTGGVLALRVNNILTLNANIDASGLGFRGGEMVSASNNCNGGLNNANDYYYETGNWRGAHKGEGIASLISGKELGKGAQANGGGGGNDHNSGGGGGANVTDGGDGGERSTSFLTTSCKGEHPGDNGRAIQDTEGRIFFGGGGGAGHTNNQLGSAGGNGGGIIIIQAKTIIANGHQIVSNGIKPLLVTEKDGAGGGGAGGTIILESDDIMGSLNINALGGNGGDIDLNNSNECFGPGGGGSGGRFLSTLSSNNIQVNLTGGIAGLSSSNSNSCTNENNGSKNGQNGIESSFEGIQQGLGLGGPTMITEQPDPTFHACHNTPTTLRVVAQGLHLNYQWQINQGSGFNNLEDNNIYSGTNTPNLTISEITHNMAEESTYLLVINSTCSDNNDISNFIKIELIDSPIPDFDFTTTDREVTFNNLSQHSNEYHWSFGTGDSTTIENPVFTYQEDGQYYVTLTATNSCGSFELSKFVSIGTLPTAEFEMTETEGCSPLTVEFTNNSSSNTSGFLWLFEGGTPSTSTAQNPVVSFESGGSYNVTLIAGNETGNDTIKLIDIVNVDAGPNTAFFVDVDDLEVSFNNTTGNGMSYIWDFGDNIGTSTEANPVYTYDNEGEYTATLIATNDCGSNTFTLNFTTGSLPNADFTINSGVGCTPLMVEYNNQSSGTNVGNWQWEFEGGIPATSTEQTPMVQYMEVGTYRTKLTVSNNLGSSTVTKEEVVTIYDLPDASFTYDINDGVVTFTGNGDNATSYGWNFGDGTFSNELNPVHTYENSGVHAVTFTTTNPSCGNSVTELINITLSSLDNVEDLPEILVYPNPTKEQITLWIENQPFKDLELQLYNTNGQLVQVNPQKISNAYQLNLANVPQGVYFLKIVTDEWQTVRKITKQ